MRQNILAAVVLAMPAVLTGAVISNPTTGVVNTGFGTSGVRATVSNVVVGVNATGGGTACFSPFCPGGTPPGAGPDYTVLDPVTFRFTDVSIVCGAANCVNLFLRAAFSFVAQTSGVFDIGVSMEGFTDAGVSGSVSGSLGNGSASRVGNRSFTVTGTPTTAGDIQDSFEIGTLAIEQGQTVRGTVLVQIRSMTRGTIEFPDSITMTLAEVPEPAALGLVLAGFVALGLGALVERARKTAC
ncbi:MAG: hypothetical protein JST93_26485 [Acidobacteria bacterium]|nr:hypothetical protein [Acidobacteriota bacterium]